MALAREIECMRSKQHADSEIADDRRQSSGGGTSATTSTENANKTSRMQQLR